MKVLSYINRPYAPNSRSGPDLAVRISLCVQDMTIVRAGNGVLDSQFISRDVGLYWPSKGTSEGCRLRYYYVDLPILISHRMRLVRAPALHINDLSRTTTTPTMTGEPKCYVSVTVVIARLLRRSPLHDIYRQP